MAISKLNLIILKFTLDAESDKFEGGNEKDGRKANEYIVIEAARFNQDGNARRT